MHPVTLVSGPPCAGKSTLVEHLAGPGDVVLDFDRIARGELAGSLGKWDHPPAVRREADRLMRERMRIIATGGPSAPSWVIRMLPDGHTRKVVGDYLGATRRVLLLPPLDMLLERAAARPDPAETEAAIRRWLAEYSPQDGDEVIRGALARSG